MSKTIDEMRDYLLTESSKRNIDPKLKAEYTNGVLDMYLDIRRELIHEQGKEPRREPAVSSRA